MISFLALNYSITPIGRNISKSKFYYIWELEIEGMTHKIEFWDSRTSGKRRYLIDRMNENSQPILIEDLPFSFEIEELTLQIFESNGACDLMIQESKFSKMFSLNEKKLYYFSLNPANKSNNIDQENEVNKLTINQNQTKENSIPHKTQSVETKLLCFENDDVSESSQEKKQEKEKISNNSILNLGKMPQLSKENQDLLDNCSHTEVLQNSDLILPEIKQPPPPKNLNKENINNQNLHIHPSASSNKINCDNTKKENKDAYLKNIPLNDLLKMKNQTKIPEKSSQLLNENCKSVPHIPMANITNLNYGFMYTYMNPFQMYYNPQAKFNY